jgi:hypothetical protein
MSKMPKKQTLEQTRPLAASLDHVAEVGTEVGAEVGAAHLELGDNDDGDNDGDTIVPARPGDDGARSKRFKEVWLVEDRKNARSVWTRVGVAFENADGSWNIRLSAVPVGGGRLNVRDPLPRERAVTA